MSTSQKHIVVVLSGGLTSKGRLPFFVKNRLDHAYKIFHQKQTNRIIVAGKSSLFVEDQQDASDAEKMAQYLHSLGVPEQNILKEEYSKDLLSSVYYIKKKLLIPRRIRNIRVIGSDFEEERLKFAFRKILGKDYSVVFDFVHSQIRSEVLWNFFNYERQALANTKAFLRKMKNGQHDFLDNKFYSAKLYKEKRIGYIRTLVHQGAIGKRRNARAHYSLKNIYRKRAQIFEKYAINAADIKIMMADFWSGRFLNFFGKDDESTLYSLKFVLYVKDKKTFANEIKITEFLQKKGIEFIPTIIGKDIEKAPPWYLYRVVDGKIAGQFSYTYSFSEYFYKKNVIKPLVSHLKTIRTLPHKGLQMPVWDSKKFRSEITTTVKKIESWSSIEKSPLIQDAYQILLSHISIFDTAKKYLTHADLHPANIIVSKKKLYLIDFEHICMNNIAFDFCFVYIFAWNNPEFRENFTKEFVKSLTEKESEEFKKLFPFVHMYFLLFLLRFTYAWEYKSGKENAKIARKTIKKELSQILSAIKSD